MKAITYIFIAVCALGIAACSGGEHGHGDGPHEDHDHYHQEAFVVGEDSTVVDHHEH